jgi:hypothetical protein
MRSNNNWLSVSRIGNDRFVVNATENTSTNSRRGTVTVTAGDQTRTFTVKQAPSTDPFARLASSNLQRREDMVTVGRVMHAQGYELSFIAGMLANIMNEGSFGQFEFVDSRRPYFEYFVNNHNYATRFSGQLIHNIEDLTTNELYNIVTNSPNYTSPSGNIFGLGILQWTNAPRHVPLLEQYQSASGGGRITDAQAVVEAETNHLLSEIRSGDHNSNGTWRGVTVATGRNLYTAWRNAHSENLNSETAARNAGYVITHGLIRPADTASAAAARANDAALIYDILTGRR